ncbi:flagellar hook-associated protein FlgK [Oceanobacillus piezotolerans]|uniref:Flagellar hook-associated protein 1 n=1 Tax=Oceanobacillus piezotolerans TaxID=2448030 RepID=A0A498DQ23_9BACI|nr:flagellar hook-associated protein FlgK [Oceanobacillus piezotolerans]RLL46659.1 flagellar hook-associated protein FlgK [Oceanobacillus piezotolerans]
MSTFHGLEMAKQALFAQQSALYTTSHNIANANTEGYTRQRVNFESTTPFPAGSRNRPQIPGQIGTGVEAGSIQRIRNEYLDTQFRGENTLAGYWESRANALSRLENLLNEPSETGLSASMDGVWQSLQDLAVNPENSGARAVVAQRGQALADTFNYLSNSLSNIRGDLKQQINSNVDQVNTILKQISDINQEVKKLEVHGYVTNDLYDKRDLLIDELSKIMNVEVDHSKSSDNASDVADGLVTITFNGQTLVDGAKGDHQKLAVAYHNATADPNEKVYGLNFVDENNNVTGQLSFPLPPESQGSLNALIEAYGYGETNDTNGDFVAMLATFDDMAASFVQAFNGLHEGGLDLNGNAGLPFFSFDPAGVEGAATIVVNSAILDNPDLIAASNDGNTGDGGNARDLANVFELPLSFKDGEVTSIKEYYESEIGKLGVKAQEANRMADNTSILLTQVENQRLSVSSVSLDEEMVNMIKFQHAYNAAARSMTATDELLDRIINNMGLVGR